MSEQVELAISEILNEQKDIKPDVEPFQIRWFNILDRGIREFLRGKTNNDLIIIAGPRRVGKTTVLKALKEKYKDKVIYIRIDNQIVTTAINKTSLKYVLEKLLEKLKKGRYVIMLDEITSLGEKWDDQVKDFYDWITQFNHKILLIVSGSLSMAILEKHTKLAGRRSKSSYYLQNYSNPFMFLPLKFSTFVQRLHQDFWNDISQGPIEKWKRNRIDEIFEILSLYKITSPKLADLLKEYNPIKNRLLSIFNEYLRYGGFPQIISNRISNSPSQLQSIFREHELSFLEDLRYINLDKDEGEVFLRVYKEYSKGSTVIVKGDLFNKFLSELSISRSIVKNEERKYRKYLDYFVKYNVFVEAYNEALKLQISLGNDIVKMRNDVVKWFVLDPGIFGYFFRNRIRNDEEFEGKLLEHVVCSHLTRLGNVSDISLSFFLVNDTSSLKLEDIINEDNIIDRDKIKGLDLTKLEIDCILKMPNKDPLIVQVARSSDEAKSDLIKARLASLLLSKVDEKFKNSLLVSLYKDNKGDGIKIEQNLGIIMPIQYFLLFI